MEESLNLTITDQEILGLLSEYDATKQNAVLLKALRIGLIALKDIQTSGNVDYVEKEFQKLKGELDKQFIAFNEDFAKSLKTTDELIKEKLKDTFDPAMGIMPRVLERYLGEGGTLADLFDERNSTSATSKIKAIFSQYFDEDASILIRLLDSNNPQSPLSAFKKEITERLISIEKEIKAKEAATEARKAEAEKGTRKGLEYEQFVFAEIEKLAHVLGDTCIPTGKQDGQILNNKTGDVVVTLNPGYTGGATLRIVFEAKDKEMYLSTLLQELDIAKKNRLSSASIGVINGQGVIKDVNDGIGTFRDYHGSISVCVLDKEVGDPTALEVAYKLARAKLLLGLKAKEMKSESIDLVAVNTMVDEIKNALSQFTTIKSTLTKASSAIGTAQSQIDELKSDLAAKLEDLSDKIRPLVKT